MAGAGARGAGGGRRPTKTTLSGKTKLEQFKGMGKTYWYNRTEFKLFYV